MTALLLVILAATAPAAVLLYYIFSRDSAQKEPVKLVVKGAAYGALSGILVLAFHTVAGFLKIAPTFPETALGQFLHAFLDAGIPEECAKLLMLWLLLRRNKYFDEYADGVVYAASVGLGFAALENVIYLFSSVGALTTVAVSRALISVPGHFFFAVTMGYFYSLASFRSGRLRTRYLVLALVVPVLFHGLFDAVLMIASVEEALALALTVAFFVGLHFLRKFASARIDALLLLDGVRAPSLAERKKERRKWAIVIGAYIVFAIFVGGLVSFGADPAAGSDPAVLQPSSPLLIAGYAFLMLAIAAVLECALISDKSKSKIPETVVSSVDWGDENINNQQ